MSATSAPAAGSGWAGAAQRHSTGDKSERAKIGPDRPKRDKPRRQSPVIPRAQPAIRTLMIAMSVMCYLASLAIGGLILINRAVDSWTTDMAREVTVQVRPVQGHEVETELARAAELIGDFAGITEVRVLGRAAALATAWPLRGPASCLLIVAAALASSC